MLTIWHLQAPKVTPALTFYPSDSQFIITITDSKRFLKVILGGSTGTGACSTKASARQPNYKFQVIKGMLAMRMGMPALRKCYSTNFLMCVELSVVFYLNPQPCLDPRKNQNGTLAKDAFVNGKVY